MRRIILTLVVLTLISSILLAAGEKAGLEKNKKNETGEKKELNKTGVGQNQTIKELRNQTKEEIAEIKDEIKEIKAENKEQLKKIIETRKQEMNDELKNLSETEQKVYKNQNAVREAVHTLLAMENRTGGIGRNISAIAREFNNSVRATINAEERIQKRSHISRFLFGGDDEAASEIEQEATQNKQRLQKLKQLKENCSECDDEMRVIMQDQINAIEQEENRLTQLAQSEKKSRGLLGWLWKR